jgi:hypothetical protein
VSWWRCSRLGWWVCLGWGTGGRMAEHCWGSSLVLQPSQLVLYQNW